MMGLNQNIKNAFKNGFEVKCFRLIIEAYQLAKNKKVIQPDWHENDIISTLNNLIGQNEKRAKWKISTNVEHHLYNEGIKKVKRYASKLSRIDLRFVTFYSSLEYEYYLEAKNLKESDSNLKRRYIQTGVDHFINKKYENGSLIGYLLEGRLDETVNGLNAWLERNNRESECLKPKAFKLHKNYYESEHGEIVLLKHLIFDFGNPENSCY